MKLNLNLNIIPDQILNLIQKSLLLHQNVQMLETELAAAKNLVLKMESQLKIEIQQREDYKKQCEDLKRKLKEVQDELANTLRQLEEARRIIEQYKKVNTSTFPCLVVVGVVFYEI